MLPPPDHQGEWRSFRYKEVVVRVAPGLASPNIVAAIPPLAAATAARALLVETLHIVDQLRKVLAQPAPAGAQVEIVLCDASGEHEDHGTAKAPITFVHHLDPNGRNQADDSLRDRLTRELVKLWLGESALPPFFLDGIAGIVAARTARGASLQEADDWVREQLAEGFSIAAQLQNSTGATQSGDAQPRAINYAATSFVAYLLAMYGPHALRSFLVSGDPERCDHGAQTAFQQPLAVLQEAWLGSLRGRRVRGTLGILTRQLIELTRDYRPQQAELLVYMALTLAYSLLLPLASRYLLDQMRHNFGGGAASAQAFIHGTLLPVIGAMGLLFFVNAAVWARRSYVTNWLNQHILRTLQERMFAHLQRLPHQFYARSQIGDVITRLNVDLGLMQDALKQIGSSAPYQVLLALATSIVMVRLSPLLGLLVIVVAPIFAVSFALLARRFQDASRELQKLTGATTSAVQENLAAHSLIKAFGMEESAVASYHARQMTLLKCVMSIVNLRSLSDLSQLMAVTFAQLLILGAGGYMVVEGRLSIGTLFAFYQFLPQLFGPVTFLTGVAQSVEIAAGALDRTNELFAEPEVIRDRPGAAALAPLENEIALEKVTYGYDSAHPVLHGIDLTIRTGSHVCLVGPSGGGKSTFVGLLMRFWDPQEGQVSFDGHDLRDATLASLRAQIGLVSQDTFIFDTTVRENIAIGRPHATDLEIAAAARAAQLEDYIASLPDGYDTVLGERGVRMSGGQRQRLALARVVLRKPRILLLDEATSALDSHTEREIHEALTAIGQGCTTISITHRLAEAVGADRIFVIADGRLVEEGTHDELLRANGMYHRLYDEQTRAAAETGRFRGADANLLRSVPLFAETSDDDLEHLAQHLNLERYCAGEEIAQQGKTGGKLYLINSGQCDVLMQRNGAPRRINVLNEGDYFGELPLLRGDAYSATVRAASAVQLFSLEREVYLHVVNRS